MSPSLRLSPAEPGSPEADAVRRVADAAAGHDGTAPFNEQTELDLAAGRRTASVLREEPAGATVGAIATGGGEIDLVVAPDARRRGVATAALAEVLPRLEGPQSAWSHGDHPAAAALARRHGFERARTLLRLRRDALGEAGTASGPAQAETQAEAQAEGPAATDDGEVRVDAFRPGDDDAEWVALNARIFAAHPEQGGITLDDLHDRMAETWFDAGDFLVARDDAGRMLGYDWLKIEPGEAAGEIYVIGVDPAAAGRGLGRRLLRAGLERLAERGCGRALLYVEGDNAPALGLYRSEGFVDDLVDVQYRRG